MDNPERRRTPPVPGDRVEHAAVAGQEETARLAAHGVTVVTQPAFVADRGDAYLRDVDPEDRPDLWPCASLAEHGVPVGGSTDAPFGHPDPWRAITAAIDRRTTAGIILGERERLSPEQALALFLSRPTEPGGPPRRIAPGYPADLCVLDVPLSAALQDTSSEHVLAVVRRGHPHVIRS